jgi:hypothetical protein
MLFAYRGGKNPISRRAWLKLERIECEVGVGPQLDAALVAASIVKESSGRYGAEPARERNRRIAGELRRLADELDPPV